MGVGLARPVFRAYQRNAGVDGRIKITSVKRRVEEKVAAVSTTQS
jgi:hypothetical protein